MVEVLVAGLVVTSLLFLANGLWIGCLFGRAWERTRVPGHRK